jgi:hypothetical protein
MGAEPDVRGGYDESTPLHIAAWHDQPDAISVLLDLGASIDHRSGPKENDTPLNWAIVNASIGAARVLIDGGATVGDEQRRIAESGLNGRFKSHTGVDPARYAELVALVGSA